MPKKVKSSKNNLRRRSKKASKKKSKKTDKISKNTMLIVDDSKLGFSEKVRDKNLNKFLIQAHKNNMKKLKVTDNFEYEKIYIVKDEISKRKLKV